MIQDKSLKALLLFFPILTGNQSILMIRSLMVQRYLACRFSLQYSCIQTWRTGWQGGGWRGMGFAHGEGCMSI